MRSRLISLTIIGILIPVMRLAESAERKTMVGVWEVKVSPVGQARPLLSLSMCGADGSFTTGVGSNVLPPVAAVRAVADELGPGYGRWTAVGDGNFQLTFYSVLWKAGVMNGYQRVQDTLVLSESGDECTSRGHVEWLEANWNVVFSTTSEVKARRLEGPISAPGGALPTREHLLTGLWKVSSSPFVESQSPLLSVAIFAHEGSAHMTGGYKALPPVAAVQGVADEIGSGYGRWIVSSEREFRLIHYSVLCKAGVVTGFQRVRSTLSLSESGEEYSEHAQVDFLDANWNVVFSTTKEAKGTRLEGTPGLVGRPAGRRGVWEVAVWPVGGTVSPLLGIAISSGDGSFISSIGKQASLPTPALQELGTELGPLYGQWAGTSNAKENRLVSYGVIWKAGLVSGFRRIRSTEILSKAGAEFTSSAQVEFLDKNLNVIGSLASEARGKRLETPGRD